jgi:hypothetical protein
VGGRVWLWVIPFIVLYGLWSFFGFDISGPSNRDFGALWEKPVSRAQRGGCAVSCCARPTGGSYGLTTEGHAQRRGGAMRRPS